MEDTAEEVTAVVGQGVACVGVYVEVAEVWWGTCSGVKVGRLVGA